MANYKNRLTQAQFVKIADFLRSLTPDQRKRSQTTIAQEASSVLGFGICHMSLKRAADAANVEIGIPSQLAAQDKRDERRAEKNGIEIRLTNIEHILTLIASDLKIDINRS